MKSPPTLTSVASGARNRKVTVRSVFTSQETIGGGAFPLPPPRAAGADWAFDWAFIVAINTEATRKVWYMAGLYTQRFPHFAAHEKFAASSALPDPEYFATVGYGHRGRVRATPLAGLPSALYFVATIFAGAVPFSTHCSSDLIMLWSVSARAGD